MLLIAADHCEFAPPPQSSFAVELLAETGVLPEGYSPHPPSGEWKGVAECHIEPDWLLIYEVAPGDLLLIRTGTHRDLFG